MPQPMHATFTRSLGLLDLSSSAHVMRPATQNPTPARAEPLRKSRRLVRRVIWTAPASERRGMGRGTRALFATADVAAALARPPGRAKGKACAMGREPLD